MTNDEILESLKEVIEIENESLKELSEDLNDSYLEALNLLENCTGKVIITGVGKSGHIGRKMAATFASTGTSSFFMHSTEGVHGDLGMVTEDDVVVALSNSGETKEVFNLLPSLKKINAQVISITSNKDSLLGKNVDVSLDYGYLREADYLQLAPTTSSTIMLVIGDALAITLAKMKGFTKEDFHLYHPGGKLGEQLNNME